MSTINLVTAIPGPQGRAMLERRKNATPAGLAKSTEVVVAKAEGGVVWDVDGNTLLDFAGGIGMINVGHRPEAVVNAIKDQLDKYIHTCSLVTTFEPYVQLAEMLNKLTPGDHAKKTLLCNTGTEAVENAVMLARYYTKRPGIICFEGAYHGRSLLTLSLTSKYSLFKKGFGSFTSDIYRLPVPNLYRTPDGMTEEAYLDWCIKNLEHAFIAQVDPEAVAAFIIEPVLGEGGFIQMPAPFMQKIRELCDKHGIVMIADEIQSGSGRTGKLFAIEHTGVVPDVMTIAKSLGAGMPVSAVVGKAEIMDCTHLGGVGGTYGGSPVTAVAAIEALKILSSEEFLSRATHVGQLIKSTLDTWKEKYAMVGDVRATGAMCLVEFVKDKSTKEPDIEIAMEVLKDALWQENRGLAIRLKNAQFKISASLEDLDYRSSRGLKRAQIEQLRASAWVKEHRNCLITGPTGSGKTYLACAVGTQACREGYRTLYYYAPKFFRALETARADGSLLPLLKKLARAPLILVDDLGIASVPGKLYREFLEMLDDRQGQGATLITSQFPVSQWHEVIADATVADAILDRLVHNAYRIELKGESLRKGKTAPAENEP